MNTARDPLWPFLVDWEKVLKERFPDGIKPTETPFMQLINSAVRKAKPND